MSNLLIKAQTNAVVPYSETVMAQIAEINEQDEGMAYQSLRLFGIIKDSIWISQEGSETPLAKVDALEGQIIIGKITRVLYANRKDKVPSCTSNDGGRHGVLHPELGSQLSIASGQTCALCLYNQWGTATDEAGNKKKGKACKERRNLLMLHPDYTMPIVLGLAPTSIKAWDRYANMLRTQRPPSSYLAHLTRVQVSIERGEDGTYGMAEFSSAGALPEEAVLNAIRLREIYEPMLGRIETLDEVLVSTPSVLREETPW